jgi:Transport and Golgi organisation 2
MCTVTFLPKGEGKYILTSNRDETPVRAAAPPQIYQIHDQAVTFPKDPLAGGTWIATDNNRFTLCLLNGAFEKHKHIPPYKTSRGIMLLDFFQFNDADSFQSTYDFEGIEPFTLVIVDTQATTKLFELRWDEQQVSFKEFPNDVPRIWSSSTLYPKEIADQREDWFKDWLSVHEKFERSEIINFHKNGGRGDLWNNFIMKRGDNLQTVSITSIEKGDDFEMVYEDLVND